jgi:NAD+ synthase
LGISVAKGRSVNKLNDFSPETARLHIEHFLRERLAHLQRKGAVVPFSGGLDSSVAAALTVRALGPKKATLLNLPEQDSSPLHQQHARHFAGTLGAELVVIPITRILQAMGTYHLLPVGFIPGRSLRAAVVGFIKQRLLRNPQANLLADRLKPPKNRFFARGSAYGTAKHRTRMVIVYQYAESRNLMVVGAANRTEWLTGTFSKWGVDHCADVMPLLHLYRSQLKKIAAHLNLPEYLLHKPADPDVMPGVNDKGSLLGEMELTDEILHAMESGTPVEVLKSRYPPESVEKLVELHALSAHMRHSPFFPG